MAARELPGPGLEKLHEILVPDPVSWMPETIGWYVLFGLILLVLGRWICGRVRRYRRNRYRRSALSELALIEQKLQRGERRAEALAAIPLLLKRTALSAFPRDEVAVLSGEPWLAFLDETMGGKRFADGDGRLLSELAYAPGPRIAGLPDESINGILQLARRWISTHVA